MDPSLGATEHVHIAFRIAMMRLSGKLLSLFYICIFIGFEYRTSKDEGPLSWNSFVALRELLKRSNPSAHLC